MNKIIAADVQDAYHYALAANRGYWGHHATVFAGNNAEFSRTGYLQMAYKKALEAGIVGIKRPRKLVDAVALLTAIDEQAKAAGIHAYSGEPLCTCCRKEARELGYKGHQYNGLCIECYETRAKAVAAVEPLPWQARADAALISLSVLDAAALGEVPTVDLSDLDRAEAEYVAELDQEEQLSHLEHQLAGCPGVRRCLWCQEQRKGA